MSELHDDKQDKAPNWMWRPGGAEAIRLLLNPPDAARALAISPRALHDLAKSGQLKRVLIGRSVRFDVRDLMAFIDAKKEATH